MLRTCSRRRHPLAPQRSNTLSKLDENPRCSPCSLVLFKHSLRWTVCAIHRFQLAAYELVPCSAVLEILSTRVALNNAADILSSVSPCRARGGMGFKHTGPEARLARD